MSRKPGTLLWNLQRLAECLRLVAEEAPLLEALSHFPTTFEGAFAVSVLTRLNLTAIDPAADLELVGTIYAFLNDTRMSFEQFFFDWQGGLASDTRAMRGPAREYYAAAFDAVRAGFAARAPAVPDRLAHDYFQSDRPTTLLIDEIETLWAAIDTGDDWRPLTDKLAAMEAAGHGFGTLPQHS